MTAVGGTSLGVGAANDTRVRDRLGHEQLRVAADGLAVTRTGCLYGAGGGVSTLFAEPWYQKGAGA